MADLFTQIAEFIPDSLIASSVFPIITEGIRLGSDQGLLKRGTLVGKASDGFFYRTGAVVSEETVGVFGILSDDFDSGSEELIAVCYITGCFNRDAVLLTDGLDISEFEDDLKGIGIYLKSVQFYK